MSCFTNLSCSSCVAGNFAAGLEYLRGQAVSTACARLQCKSLRSCMARVVGEFTFFPVRRGLSQIDRMRMSSCESSTGRRPTLRTLIPRLDPFRTRHVGFLASAAQVTADALQRFYRNRMPRVAGISLLSGLASDLIINARV